MNLRALRVLQLIMTMVFVAHLLSCAWWYVGMQSQATYGVSWMTTYDEGAGYDAPLSKQYHYAIYWALTTLTTVGYGDITPTSDLERRFTTVALLLGALIFAYILGDIGSLLQTLDRQTLLVNERMDAVKEYLQWRGIPKELGVRVRRYYEHYYTQRAIFDESTIITELNPQLQTEVVQRILSRTMSRLPLFAQLDPDLRFALFPLLKPLSFQAGELILSKGQTSRELLFLLDGEVDELSAVDDATPVRQFVKDAHGVWVERMVAGYEASGGGVSLEEGGTLRQAAMGADAQVAEVESIGCFGESMMLGQRHRSTYMSRTKTECLLITKADLANLFSTNGGAVALPLRRLCNLVLRRHLKMTRLRKMADVLRMAAMERGAARSALLIQFCWHRLLRSRAMRQDALYAEIAGDAGSAVMPSKALGAILSRLGSLEASSAKQHETNSALLRENLALQKLLVDMRNDPRFRGAAPSGGELVHGRHGSGSSSPLIASSSARPPAPVEVSL